MFNKKLWERIRVLEGNLERFGREVEFGSTRKNIRILQGATKKIEHRSIDTIDRLNTVENKLDSLLENFEEHDEIEGGIDFAIGKMEYTKIPKKIVTKYRLKSNKKKK